MVFTSQRGQWACYVDQILGLHIGRDHGIYGQDPMAIGQACWHTGQGYGRTGNMATNNTTKGIGMDSEQLPQIDWDVKPPKLNLEEWTRAFDRFWMKREMPISIDIKGRPVYERDTTKNL